MWVSHSLLLANGLVVLSSTAEDGEIEVRIWRSRFESRKPQYSMASELPLNLFHCEYEQGTQWYMNQECLAQVVRTLQSTWTKLYIKASMVRTMLLDLESSLETPVSEQTSCLLQGVRSKVYQPLLKRPTCGESEPGQLWSAWFSCGELGGPHRALCEETAVRGDGDGGSEPALRRVFRLSWGWALLVVSCVGHREYCRATRPKVLVWSDDLDRKMTILVPLRRKILGPQNDKLGLLYVFVRRKVEFRGIVSTFAGRESGKNHCQYTRQDLKPNLPVIGSLNYWEKDVLEHSNTEAGFMFVVHHSEMLCASVAAWSKA
uniref:(California timema) hypothetical protein n=1 Tax=Timema californicum TaxID=61474 RepID=A0A7R9J088_TIMCA|nr:unnamed protein product [Timema californicum]